MLTAKQTGSQGGYLSARAHGHSEGLNYDADASADPAASAASDDSDHADVAVDDKAWQM